MGGTYAGGAVACAAACATIDVLKEEGAQGDILLSVRWLWFLLRCRCIHLFPLIKLVNRRLGKRSAAWRAAEGRDAFAAEIRQIPDY